MNETIAAIQAIFQTFLASPEGTAIKALLIGSIGVFAIGAFAALRDKTFDFKYVDSFVRSTLWGRVAPITTFLLLGYVSGEALITGPTLIAAGVVAAGMIASALESLRQLTMPAEQSATVNTVPTA